MRAKPETMPAEIAKPAVAKSRRADPARIARIPLQRPSPETLASHAGQPSKPGAPTKVGFARSVDALASEAGTAVWLDWAALSGGERIAAIAISSPEAVGMRIGLRIGELPAGTLLRFYAETEALAVEVTGNEAMETIARNLAADRSDAGARTYWSPVADAPTAVLEIEIPADADPAKVRLAVPEVSHLFATARADWALPKAAGACNIDASCHQATWSNESNAVAKMLFTDSGNSFLCTGTLLADSTPATFIPYFLTANHCISTQVVASTLVTYWFYRSAACNSGVPGSWQALNGGATLLYASGTTDTSFMSLNATPPAGAMFAGWTTAAAPAIGTDVTGIHHPAGDLQRISFGDISGYDICTPSGGGFTCNSASSTSATFYRTAWTGGVTEGGSSGSGLFLNSGRYLVGQLYGGGSSCATPASPDFYGRFSVAYDAALYQWLASATPDWTLTVNRAGTGTGTVTSSPAGINCGATCSAGFNEGTMVTLSATASADSAFAGWSGSGCSGIGSCSVTLDADKAVTATFTLVPPPANDDFADRITLAGGVASSMGTTVAATREPGEPDHAGNAGGRSVWWSWTAPSSGMATIQTQGSAIDTLLAVYTGTSVGALTPVASNNDVGPSDPSSFVTFSAAAGAAYQIAVDGFNGGSGAASGAVVINVSQPQPVTVNLAGSGAGTVASSPAGISCAPTCTANYPSGIQVTFTATPASGSSFIGWSGGGCSGTGNCAVLISVPVTVTATFALTPVNDAFADRIAQSGASVATTGSSAGASKEMGEPDHAGNAGGKSVWWSWTAPETGIATITTAGSGFDTLLAVYTGMWLSRLMAVASNDNDGGLQTSAVSFAATAGTVYLIAVDGRDGASGAIVLNINPPLAPVVTPPGDFSGDGKSDVFWRDATDGLNYQWQMNGLAISGQGYLPSVPASWTVAGIGDVNGNGIADVFWRETTGLNYLWMTNGLTVASQGYLPTVPNPWIVVGLGDASGDGRADVFWRNPTSGQNYLWMMNGLAISSQGYLPSVAGSDWEVVGVADYNGDTRADVLWRNKTTGENYLWMMNGLVLASQGYLPTVVPTDWEVVATPDANGDGSADVLWRHKTNGQMYLWLMNGLALSGEGYLPSVADANWKVVGYGDYDGDGKGDVLWRNATTGANYLWTLNGISVATQGYLPSVTGANWQPVKR